jgi:hypothetical protein
VVAAVGIVCVMMILMSSCGDDGPTGPEPLDPALVAQGKTVFRFDTFRDETFWTDTARLHEVVVQELHRGPVSQNGAR